MTIKFTCSCGKHLRAREDLAARRVLCPRCRTLVGVPSLQPTHPGTVANPMTPEERRRQARRRAPAPVAPADAAPPPPTPSLAEAAEAVTLRQKPPRRREARWYHCLVYACRAWPLVLLLGLGWALGAGGWSLLRSLALDLAEPPPWLGPVAAGGLLLALALAGYTWAVLDCALIAAAAGEVAWVRWPGADVRLILKSMVRWLLALVAGPVVLAVAAFWYWLHGGELGVLDGLILAELGTVAVAWWLLAAAAAGERERLRDVNPLAVARLGYRLGYGGLVVLGAAVVALGHAVLALAALDLLHRSLPGAAPSELRDLIGAVPDEFPTHVFAPQQFLEGAGLLALAGVSGVFLATFLFRLVGTWCYRSRTVPAPEPPPAA